MSLKKLAPAALLALGFFVCLVDSDSAFEEFASWTYLEFENDTNPWSIRENGIFTGIQVSNERVFLTIPRLRPGVTATLATISRDDGPSTNQKLQPFPNWSWQQGFKDGCRSLVSVFRSRLDPCGRLWVLDTGSVDVLCDFKQICPPKIVVFDPDGTEVFRVVIPQQLLKPDSLLVSLALDTRGPGRLQTCAQTKEIVLYISDVIPGIIVYDHSSQSFWRQEHASMAPDPKFSTFEIQNETFYMEDGILGMSVGVYKLTKVLYYQPLSSESVYAIQTSKLMTPNVSDLRVVQVFNKSSQSSGLIADGMSRLFYSQISQTDIQEWNPIKNVFRPLVVDSERLQFVSDFAIDQQGSLWFTSNKFHAYFNCKFSSSYPNMRVMRIPRAANSLYFN